MQVDKDLTFDNRLDILLAVGKSSFEELGSAEWLGFAITAEVAEVQSRLEPLVLYGAALLVLASNAEQRLNRLQAGWAQTIIGTHRCPWLRPLAVRECEWESRLGTKMIVKAITLLNRLLLLPLNNPIFCLTQIALQLPCDTWVQRVVHLMEDQRLGCAVPFLHDCECFSSDMWEAARGSRAKRRALVNQYKRQIVEPLLPGACSIFANWIPTFLYFLKLWESSYPGYVRIW